MGPRKGMKSTAYSFSGLDRMNRVSAVILVQEMGNSESVNGGNETFVLFKLAWST